LKNVLITGATGFVGTNLIQYLSKLTDIKAIALSRNLNLSQITESNAIIHLAGKAHDLKKIANEADYFEINTELTKKLYTAFLQSDSEAFIFMSSVKAVADNVQDSLDESYLPDPQTAYGKSKLLAEQFILSNWPDSSKRVYILRPCMIHGPANKGNLNLLYKIVSKGIPWPLGSFDNKRSFCTVENLCFVIKELLERADIPSGIYHIADDASISTNDLIRLIAESQNKAARIWNIQPNIIRILAKMGDYLHLPLNTERLQKLTESYIVSNRKLIDALGMPLPVTAKEGLMSTLKSFATS
jgi:nucleoside-diphosphate-sugar epimerase